ncbi:MAG: hypothetical protein HQL24_02625 [Candidatus Omnitrophica bacterium]|nr:hypothetical protein [Candidatus Omnitrophota bacterium]
MFTKSLLVVAGIAVVGVVGYKILKKKNPKILKDVQQSVVGIKNSTVKLFEGAAESFKEGYASAS